MIETGVNTVLTSSCGRLFDAVAAIAGVRNEITFEGQAAIELEAIADPAVNGRYEFVFEGGELDFRATIEEIARDPSGPPAIAAKFHRTLAEAIAETCRRIRQETALTRAVLSGGTFQNMFLLRETLALLRNSGFEVYLHSSVPPNDGGLALGQALVAQSLGEANSATQHHADVIRCQAI